MPTGTRLILADRDAATLPSVDDAAVDGAARPGRRPGRQGWLITIEGPDGSGKTSQAARLRDALAAAGVPVLLTREPGGTAAGERIRDLLLSADPVEVPLDPRADALLFNAARAQHVVEVIEPALARGEVVITARYADSTLAYQGYGSELPIDELRVIGRFATHGLRPDLTVLLDLPVEVGLARKTIVENLRFETEFDRAFHERVRQGFLALAADEPDRWTVVDASRDEDDVHRRVMEAVAGLQARLGLRLGPPGK